MTKKRKNAPARTKPAVKVTKVALPPGGVVQVLAPKGVTPVAVVDPIRNVVEIVPVKKAAAVKQSWWQSLLGH